MELPNKQYKCILADPPWSYNNKKTGGTNMISSACDNYSVMSLDEICTMPVDTITNTDSCLFLWATTPLLPEAFKVMSSWGFKYKTCIYWHKILPQKLGMGFWFRGEVEVILFGIKGKIKPFRSSIPNHFNAKTRKHSQKPIELYTIIETLDINPKIELFAREQRKGWDSWGNQVPTDYQAILYDDLCG